MLEFEIPFVAPNSTKNPFFRDIILVINHNDSPPVAGLGSAIFIHLSQINKRKTQGCVAIEPLVMSKLLPLIKNGTKLSITP